jgi:uncharacterized protein (DUF488 family)
MQIFTAGYKNFSFYQFRDKVRSLNALVVDVRFYPHTLLPFWDIDFLKTSLKHQYLHLKEFGNKEFRNEGEFIIADIESGVEKMVELAREWDTFILLCACQDREKCHRKLVAERLENHRPLWGDVDCNNIEIKELENGK